MLASSVLKERSLITGIINEIISFSPLTFGGYFMTQCLSAAHTWLSTGFASWRERNKKPQSLRNLEERSLSGSPCASRSANSVCWRSQSAIRLKMLRGSYWVQRTCRGFCIRHVFCERVRSAWRQLVGPQRDRFTMAGQLKQLLCWCEKREQEGITSDYEQGERNVFFLWFLLFNRKWPNKLSSWIALQLLWFLPLVFSG